jgi:hypothetical protein
MHLEDIEQIIESPFSVSHSAGNWNGWPIGEYFSYLKVRDDLEYEMLRIERWWYFRGFKDDIAVFHREPFGWPSKDVPAILNAIDPDKVAFI